MSNRFIMLRKTATILTAHEHDRSTGQSKQVVRITNNLGLKKTECRRAYTHLNNKYKRYIPVPVDIHTTSPFKQRIDL